jgi:hypothetical protein
MDIHIQEADLLTSHGQAHSDIGGHTAFAHSAFAGHDYNLVFDLAQALIELFIILLLIFFALAAGLAGAAAAGIFTHGSPP